MREHTPNELHRELLNTTGMNPWVQHDSSGRMQMFASSHLSQTLVIAGSTERRQQTGMEREYAKYTFRTEMPCDGEVIKVIDRYRQTVGSDAIQHNPQTVVLYERASDKEVGMLNLQGYTSNHQYFGFQNKKTEAFSLLRQGAMIPEGTIFQNSPNVTDSGGYKYGRECNIAFMSHPAVSEDGIMISRDVLSQFRFKTYETRIVEFGSKRFPLNLYGDDENYRPFPDIGERIRPDGILMALRRYDDLLAVIEQSQRDLRDIDLVFDKRVYADGGGGRVVDIEVHHDGYYGQQSTPMGMDTQALRYDHSRRHFYQEILTEYNRLRRMRGESLKMTPELHQLVVEALSVVSDTKGRRVHKLYRQAPLDDWRIKFVIEYDVIPTIGFKATDCHGGKGVICHIAEPHEMPVDEAGNRADLVMDANSTISRMNLGRLFEQYVGSASRDVAARIREYLGFAPEARSTERQIAAMEQTHASHMDTAWDYLLGYYQIVSPKMFVWFTDGSYPQPRSYHLSQVINNGIYLYIPPDNAPESETIISELERKYRPVYGPVTYVGNSGRRVTTREPVRIGSVYILLLEKTGDDWTAVSSGKLQHFGVLGQVTAMDKYSQPTRNQAIRAKGESEVRIYASYAGPKITADLIDRDNNPKTHEQIVNSILRAERPTNIERAVDRTEVPLGGSKPLQLTRHLLECAGAEFDYVPHRRTFRAPDPERVIDL